MKLRKYIEDFDVYRIIVRKNVILDVIDVLVLFFYF
jgi:hypothetical protein